GAVLGVIGVIIVAVMGPAPELEAATRGEGPGIGSGPSASKQLSVEERLSKLDQLRASGAIDEAEYKAERQRVLSAV
ncbi:MAG: SHOCT domain-containing protein, partial [Deltaproteobacteria bacterium]|nr:SHOCT domain-containing protein [Deltaproteobacteria bacterium]